VVVFKQNLDRNHKIYVPRVLRKAGFDKTVTIWPDDVAAVMHPSRADLKEVMASVEMILKDIENRLHAQEETTKEDGEDE